MNMAQNIPLLDESMYQINDHNMPHDIIPHAHVRQQYDLPSLSICKQTNNK